jgi:hypothetical protein
MIFAGMVAKDFAERRKSLNSAAVLFAVTSALSVIPLFLISWNYGNILYPYQEKGYLVYFGLYVVLFVASMLAFVKISREKSVIYRRIGAEIAEIAYPHVHEFSDRRRQALTDEFELKIKRLHILEIVYAGFSVAMTLGMPFGGDYDIFGLFWFFRLIFGIVLIVYSLILTDALQKEIEKIVE